MTITASAYWCPCHASFPNGVTYVAHRRACATWSQASAKQQEVYRRLAGQTKRKWTSVTTLVLGVAYFRAHGRLPHVGHLRSVWCMPDVRTIQALFGSLSAYHQAIEEVAYGC